MQGNAVGGAISDRHRQNVRSSGYSRAWRIIARVTSSLDGPTLVAFTSTKSHGGSCASKSRSGGGDHDARSQRGTCGSTTSSTAAAPPRARRPTVLAGTVHVEIVVGVLDHRHSSPACNQTQWQHCASYRAWILTLPARNLPMRIYYISMRLVPADAKTTASSRRIHLVHAPAADFGTDPAAPPRPLPTQ